jgi:CBS domain-containing protein
MESEVAPLLSRTVPLKAVTTIGEGESVVAALETMLRCRLTAVPIVDEDGKIITPISLSDIRGLFFPGTELESEWNPPALDCFRELFGFRCCWCC